MSPRAPRASTIAAPVPGARTDLVLLGLATVALRLPAFFAGRHLTFDDGVYGASSVALREGGLPFRDVFSSQGPAFLPQVWLADLVGLHTLNGPRLLGLAAGVVLALAVYGCGREVGDRTGALLAAGLTTASSSVLWVTGPIASDGPALAASAVALWLALRYRARASLPLAVGIGLAVGLALATKLMAAPVLVPVALVLLVGALGADPTGRRPALDGAGAARLVAAAAAAAAVWLIPALAFGLADVWDQSVTYHTDVAGGRDPVANLRKVASTFTDRDTALFLVALLALGAGLAGRRPTHEDPAPAADGWPARLTPTVLLWSWLVATVALLAYVHPLWRPHVSGLVPPIGLLVAAHRPPLRATVAVAAVGAVAQVWFLAAGEDVFYFAPEGLPPATAALVAELDDLPPGAWALSDDPGLVWRAGRRTTDDLVDASVLRIESGRLTARSLAEAAADPRVCGVLVTSGVRWGAFEDLPERLAAAGYHESARTGDHRVAYLRADCPLP